MSKNTYYYCDCKCGDGTNNPQGWLLLEQFSKPRDDDKPKLRQALHFSSFKCLTKWLEDINSIVPGLIEKARGLSPRGEIGNSNFPEIYI